MSLPSIGTRIHLSGHVGTVRYAGPVDGTTGDWLGIEWDDPQRGKHSGIKDGREYFSCWVPNSGSFIRPSAKSLSYGVSFLDALQSKYIELPHGSQSIEKIILGSSNGIIQVEAANLDKIRRKFSNLARLREISLDGLLVSHSDEPGKIKNTCPNVRGLNLSMSLLPSWQSVASITSELPLLERLELKSVLQTLRFTWGDTTAYIRFASSSNRFCPPPKDTTTAFLGLRELQLNRTLITWEESQIVISYMPKLEAIQLGYNRFEYLDSPSAPPDILAAPSRSSIGMLQTLNLDSNRLGDWLHIQQSIQPYISLTRVILNSNRIETIPFPASNTYPQPSAIKAISLTSNALQAWISIDALYSWFPTLNTLHILDNPVVQDSELARYARQFIIAKIPSLKSLDGTDISSRERSDSELFYLSWISKTEGGNSFEVRRQAHPQWDALRTKHGMLEDPDAQPVQRNTDRMKNRLIDLKAYRRTSSTTGVQDIFKADPTTIRVLPTMQLQTLRQKLRKATKSKANLTDIRIWSVMEDATLSELTLDRDIQDIAWLGIDQNSSIVFHIEQ